MILCLCRGVSDRTVRLIVANGAGSVDAVEARCGAGSDCGSCRHAIEDIVDEAAAVPRACTSERSAVYAISDPTSVAA